MMTEYITNQGYSLLSRMLSGECTINFTRVEMGNGEPTESDLKRVTALSRTVCSIDVESVQINEDKTVDITATFTNTEISTQFYFKEKGVFVTDGIKEILFSYAYTRDPELIPPSTVSFMEKRLKTVMKQLQDTTAEINIQVKSGIYALQIDMDNIMKSHDDHITDKENPHEVTKEQVGLSNVPNVTTNDQTPTYTESSSLTNITSGEKISVAFGKIKKAISSLITHLADKVSHITAAERTAWNSKAEGNHKHTKSDITDFPSSLKNPNGLSINGKTYDGSSAVNVGTIGASYGGTGKTSLIDSSNALINALNAGSSIPVDADYYVCQSANGGTSDTAYVRRPLSKLWEYIKSKLSTVATTGSYSDLKNKPNYAGSSSAGGAATSANKLNTNAGSATNPIYFADGIPKACSYSLNKTVPSNAVFTDTNTWRGIQNNLTSTSTSDSLSAYQGKLLNDRINGLMANMGSVYLTTTTTIANNNAIITKSLSNGTYLIMFWLSNSSGGGAWFGNAGSGITDPSNLMYGSISPGGCIFKVHSINAAQTVGLWNLCGKSVTYGAGTCMFYMKTF